MFTVMVHRGIFGIIPAAGQSARMGAPKQILSIAGKPMLIGVAEALLAGGARGVVVVVNRSLQHDLSDLLPGAARLVCNDQPDTEMIDSIRIALDAADESDGYIVCPCDAAGITADDVRRCVEAFAQTPDRIVIATYDGKRGHPVIFPASVASIVRSSECDRGLNQLARSRPQLVRLVECKSSGTIANVNTPEDYERLA